MGSLGCGSGSGGSGPAGSAKPAASGTPGPAGEAAHVAFDFIDELPQCDVDHRGLLLDLGGSETVGRLGWQIGLPDTQVITNHDGASWVKLYDRKLALSFVLPEPTPVFVALRGIAQGASAAFVTIDGQAIGTIKLKREQIVIGSTATTTLPLDAGLHQVQLQLQGRAASASSAGLLAELDWVRIGVPDDEQRTYGAPTASDLLNPGAELGGVPHRALALRAPGAVRCTLRVPRAARLRVAVGIRGSGTAKVAVNVRRDGAPTVVVHSLAVRGEQPPRWEDLELPLEPFAGQIVSLELRATEATGTGRLLLGDPVVLVSPPAAPAPVQTRLAVVVLLSGVRRQDLPPWSGSPTPHLPTLAKLARNTAVFDDLRAPSSLVAATLASLLTGLEPRAHGLLDGASKLPASVPTLAAAVRAASIRAAMFTGVPTSFRAYGFGEGWDQFQEYPPNGGRLGYAPLDDALTWLGDALAPEGEPKPMLAVIHARGGHPPWELTPTEASALPPSDYTGLVGPRRAAQILATARDKRTRLASADLERLGALYAAGLSREDQALGRIVDKLENSGRWDSTLFVVVGDLSSGLDTLFVDGADLDEQALGVPLYVHFPGGVRAGERVAAPTEIYDLTHTLLGAFGLKAPARARGRELSVVAAGQDIDTHQIRIAWTEERYAARWDHFVLLGATDSAPRLCDFAVDPTCAYDRTALYPYVAHALFRRLAARSTPTAQAVVREQVTVDSDLAAMLQVWGAY